MKVDAKTYWVWTDKAAAADPNRVAGSPLPRFYRKSAPRDWLLRRYIVDKTKYVGQVDLYMVLESEG